MSKSAGHFLGLTLAAVIFGCGLYGTLYLCNTIEATAEPIATWFTLGGCVIAAALGTFMIIIWSDQSIRRNERN